MDKITIPFAYVISVIATMGSVVAILVLAIKHMFKIIMDKSKETTTLTTSFLEVSKDTAKALEQTTKVIEALPSQILLHIKANK